MKKKLIIMGIISAIFITGCSSEKKEEVASNTQTETKVEEVQAQTSDEKQTEQTTEEVASDEKQAEEVKAEETTKAEQTKTQEVKEEVKVEETKTQVEEVKKEEVKEVKVSQETTETKAEEVKTEPVVQAPKVEEPKAEEPKTVYKDGTYSGTAKGYAGNITVSVTIANDKITAVSVTDTIDDEPYISQAKELTNAIVANNSTSVAVVSGATYSSNGIINAAADALSKAKN